MFIRTAALLTLLHLIGLSSLNADESIANFTDLTPMALSASPYLVASSDICPDDSEFVGNICKCNTELCVPPPCDKFLNLVRNGTDTPGNCCPLYTCDNCTEETIINGTCSCGKDAFLNSKGICECIDQHKTLINEICVCDSNKCELPLLCDNNSVPVKFKKGCCVQINCKPCPGDSYVKNFQSEEIEDICICFPCPETHCNDTHVPQILHRGRNVPQQCCDLYECIPKDDPTQGCIINDIAYTTGEWWITENKQNCTCINGVSLCDEPLTTDNGKHCLANDTAYPHMATWTEDTCTICTCFNGSSKCIAHMCNVTESKVRKYQDCIFDEHTYQHMSTWLTVDLCTNCSCNDGTPYCVTLCNASAILDIDKETNCPTLDNCKKYCRNGFKTNRKGCEICKCKPPEKIIEKYPLLHVYMRSHNLSETDLLQLINSRLEEQTDPVTPPTVTASPGQNKDYSALWYIVPIITFVAGIFFHCLVALCIKKRCTYYYSPVQKPMDNNNLPPQRVKFISEKSPLTT